mmetsp:Transcript_30985/g.66693  ORF Transcript_30985/g.66693 Transcript_30985/m.66693 type:complete len:95 (+) Transcript_30985:182-466(+)
MHSYPLLGLSTASLAPLVYVVGFIIWGTSWKSSAYALNLFKCTLASLIFMIIAQSTPTNNQAPFDQLMIMVSSVIGIVIGDNTWLMALKMIGAR